MAIVTYGYNCIYCRKALYRDSNGVVVTAESNCDTFNVYNNSGRAPYYSIRVSKYDQN